MSMPLKVTQPITITDSNMTSTVPETDYAAYNAATTYAVGNRVIRTQTHRIYESLVASNIGNTPETSPTKWLDIGPTNKYAMFDTVNSTQTSQATSIVVTITPGQVVNTVGLLNLDATSVRVKMTSSPTGTVYDTTVNLNDNGTINDWYQYYFTPIQRRTDVVFTDLPSYGNGVIEITITYTSGTAKCGTCIVGFSKTLGNFVTLGASVGIQDYSRKEKDQFGNYILIQRSYSKKMKCMLTIENTQIDAFQSFMASLRTTPCLWIGNENYSSTYIYGFYKDFDVVINYPTFSECNLEIEGLT